VGSSISYMASALPNAKSYLQYHSKPIFASARSQKYSDVDENHAQNLRASASTTFHFSTRFIHLLILQLGQAGSTIQCTLLYTTLSDATMIYATTIPRCPIFRVKLQIESLFWSMASLFKPLRIWRQQLWQILETKTASAAPGIYCID
jgi:hypothetical protein